MYIVIDWHCTEVFGTFNTKEEAQDWLAKQEILLGQYEEQEVGVYRLKPISERLQEISK